MEEFVFEGAASGAAISGGLQDVQEGIALGTSVGSGGTQRAEFGGTAVGATVDAGGLLDIRSHGVASGATINSGGSATLEPGGVMAA